MFRRIARHLVLVGDAGHCSTAAYTQRRAISTHSSFPATLLRLNAGERFKQFRFEDLALSNRRTCKNNRILDDSFEKTAGWLDLPFSDTATLLPNTFKMQEIIRTAVDNYAEDVEDGLIVERPFIFTVPKGTPIPNTLLLMRIRTAEFALQPRTTSADGTTSTKSSATFTYIPSLVLSNALEEFYSKYAEKRDADEWLENHNFEEAVADDAEMEWMKR